jgi:hypothetical protein
MADPPKYRDKAAVIAFVSHALDIELEEPLRRAALNPDFDVRSIPIDHRSPEQRAVDGWGERGDRRHLATFLRSIDRPSGLAPETWSLVIDIVAGQAKRKRGPKGRRTNLRYADIEFRRAQKILKEHWLGAPDLRDLALKIVASRWSRDDTNTIQNYVGKSKKNREGLQPRRKRVETRDSGQK